MTIEQHLDQLFQSAPPVKGATHHGRRHVDADIVSIRAPREGGDHGQPPTI